MEGLLSKVRESPYWLRVAPFLIFVLLTSLQGSLGESSKYWIYTGKSLLGALILWFVWRRVQELRWTFSVEAVAVGVFVIVVWIALDPFYPKFFNSDKPWTPHAQFGEGSALAWFFVV